MAEEPKLFATFDEFAGRFSDAAEPLRGLVSDLGDVATSIKTKYIVNEDKKEERLQLLAEGKSVDAAAVEIVPVDFAAAAKRSSGIKGDIDHFGALSFLQGVLTVLRDSGHPGLLLVLDVGAGDRVDIPVEQVHHLEAEDQQVLCQSADYQAQTRRDHADRHRCRHGRGP